MPFRLKCHAFYCSSTVGCLNHVWVGHPCAFSIYLGDELFLPSGLITAKLPSKFRRRHGERCSWKMPWRLRIEILLRPVQQSYFGVLNRAYIFWPYRRSAWPAKGWTALFAADMRRPAL